MEFPERWKQFGFMVSCFAAGMAFYQGVLTMAQLEVGPRHSSCPKGQVALRVEAFPFDAKVKVLNISHDFYEGICLAQGRYGVEVSAERHQTESRVIQLGASDQLLLFNLKPKIVVSINNDVLSKERRYRGEPVSVNFAEIDVRSAVQLLADFSNKNIVVANNAQGVLSLRIQNVPWDQVLDAIVFSTGNVLVLKDGIYYVSAR
jgi:hypothetical protein